ncbi:MAG: ATP-dependent Clp protease proteolytic subunit [Phycisphaerales bacterium]|nr:MAG: ATP-dependent Clp protease proteolytic subunit [Phycisphaerales bacterium]
MSTYDPRLPGTLDQYQAPQRYREMSIEDLLLDNRIIFLAGPITERTASIVIMRLLYLQSIKKASDINLYINSPGGLVDQTLAIYDTMKFLGCDVATYCIGQASSGAAIILAAGAKGKRFALPNAKIMLHQPYGGITGQAEDIRIQAEEVIKDKKLLIDILAKCTGQAPEVIERETERDRYMNAEEAMKYGLVDEILSEVEPSEKKKK